MVFGERKTSVGIGIYYAVIRVLNYICNQVTSVIICVGVPVSGVGIDVTGDNGVW